MAENTNIENLFSNKFNNYSAEPNNLTWDNIESNLNENFVELEYKTKFNNYNFTPNASTWSSIYTKLWLNNFVQFSYNSFNIYYAASIIAIVFTSFILLNKPNTSSNINTKLSETHTTIKPNNNNNNKQAKNIISTSNINETKNINNTKNTNKQIINNTVTSKNNSYNKHNLNNTNNTINYSNSINNTNHKYTTYTPENKDSIESLISTNNDIAFNAPSNITTEFIVDTVIIRDTVKIIIRDTVFKDNPKDILAKSSGFSPWSVDAYYSPMFYNSANKYNSDISSSMKNNLDTSYSSIYNYTLGANANYKINNFNIQAGLAYTKYLEKFTYQEQRISTNTYNDKRFMAVGEYSYINKYTDWVISGSHTEIKLDTTHSSYEVVEYELHHATVIDTIWNYTIDSLAVIVMDSTQVVIYDTITATKYDSVDVVIVDSIINLSFYDVINQYSYIEIPLMIGYEFNSKRKLSYVVNAGLVTGIFINAKGKGVTLSNKIVDLNSLPFMKFNFSGMLTAGIHYSFTKEMSLILEATYRKNFTSIYETSYYMQKRFNSFGLRAGIKYKF